MHTKQQKFNELSPSSQSKVLRNQICKLYIYLKDLTRQSQARISVDKSLLGLGNTRSDEEEVRTLDTFIVLEYIKSAIEIILNLKFEEIEGKLREEPNLALG